jgi:hypothetical protein
MPFFVALLLLLLCLASLQDALLLPRVPLEA